MMKHRIPIIAALLLALAAGTSLAQVKKRVAVFTFDNKSHEGWHWWTGGSPGEGMADMLTTELVKSGKYTVIERDQIAKIMEEQNMGLSGRVTEQSAAQIGKLLGVEVAVMGAVTEFGASKGGTGGRLKGIRVGVSNQKARVAIDVRLVNTNTGEILAAENVAKEQSKSGISVDLPQGGFDNESDFDNSLAGKATRECIEEIMGLLEKQMGSAVWEGKVIQLSGASIYIKPGADAGVKVGDVFAVYTKGEALIDPDTGLSLGAAESQVGTIEVTSLVPGGKAAVAKAKTGSGFQVGDMVRKK